MTAEDLVTLEIIKNKVFNSRELDTNVRSIKEYAPETASRALRKLAQKQIIDYQYDHKTKTFEATYRGATLDGWMAETSAKSL
jgi:hypothetical protein